MKKKKKNETLNSFMKWDEAFRKIDFFKDKVKTTLKDDFREGDKFATEGGKSYIKIMAIADGYVMARNKGCIPFCETIKEFVLRLKENCDKETTPSE